MDRITSFVSDNHIIRYVLMNKDVVVARFELNPLIDKITINEVCMQLPVWLNDLETFILGRKAPKSRANIEQLLKLSGCDTIQGYLDITHALSLIDTFWVKREDSKLQWDDVSLYTHPFNETIAKTAFEGGLHGQHLADTSPEYGTDGSFAKCWIRENGQIKLLKRGSSGARNAGLEPFGEYYASQIIKHFTTNFVDYDLRSRNGRVCSVCDIFTSEKYGFIPYAAVDAGNSSVQSVIRRYTDLGFAGFAEMMFVVDAVILNADRHKNNFGFLVSNDTQELIAPAPLFDHNLALLPYAEEGDFEIDGEYLKSQGPRIGSSWVKEAAKCLTPELRKVLINLKGFEFKRHYKLNMLDNRLQALEKIINYNIEQILYLNSFV